MSKASLTGALPVNHLRKNDYFVYAQDEYKWRPNLTLNLGLRYTIFDLFNEENGKANPFDFATCGPQGFCGVGASFGQQNYGDIDPRVAFAWTPRKSGQTVIRGGFGIYHEDGQLDDQNLPAKNEVPSYSATGSRSHRFPGRLYSAPGTLSPNAEQRNRKDTYVEQWSLSVQRELPANFVSTVLLPGKPRRASAGDQRGEPDPSGHGTCAISGLCSRHWLARLRRHELVQRSLGGDAAFVLPRPAGGGQLHWSHEIDNGSNGSGDGDDISPQNPLCLACDRASGAWDARHVVNGNAVYQLPFGPGKPMLNQRGWRALLRATGS